MAIIEREIGTVKFQIQTIRGQVILLGLGVKRIEYLSFYYFHDPYVL